MLLLVVEAEILRLPPLIRLRSLNRGHERIRYRRLVEFGGLRRRQSVQGDAEGELEGFELHACGVGIAASAAACLSEGGVGEGEEGGDHVERGGLGVAAAASHGHGLVEDGRRLLREALPGCGDGRRHGGF